jgi:hypothetical protein
MNHDVESIEYINTNAIKKNVALPLVMFNKVIKV